MNYLSVLLVLLPFGVIFGQTHSPEIEHIRDVYKETMAKKSDFKTKIKNINCPDYPENGTISYYYSSSGQLRLIEKETDDGGHASESAQFLVEDDRLIFYFGSRSSWSFADGGTLEKPNTRDDNSETRHYYKNEKPIRCLSKSYSNITGQEKKTSSQVPNEEVKCRDIPFSQNEFFELFKLRDVIVKGCVWEQIKK